MPSEFLNALKEGQTLQEYQIVRVLGAGGFGITYLAFDENLDKPVAIKEYLPNDLALRHDGTEVMAKSTEAQDDFKWGLEQFLREARILAKFNHPNIIRINRFFEANGTGYIVMDYAEGQTLTEKIKETGTLSENQLKPLLLAISDGLKQAHSFGILHRDIKPGNIMLLDDGTPILIDFGSARQAIGVKSKSVTSIVTPGYAPIEQYDTNGRQGPWTDIYALGAVAFVALVGERPPDATGRIRVDNMTPIAKLRKNRASKAFLAAIDWALCPQEESRPQSIDNWVQALSGESIAKIKKQFASSTAQKAVNIDDEKTVINKSGSKPDQKNVNRWLEGDAKNTPTPMPAPAKTDSSKYWIGGIVVVAGLVISFPYISGWLQPSDVADNQQIDGGEEIVADDDVTIADVIVDDELSDEEAWLQAVDANTIESFLNYLSLFPSGMYLADANTNLHGLSQHNNISGQFFSSSAVNIRRWPSTSASTIGSLTLGQRVNVNGRVVAREWYSLEENNIEVGFVHTSLLEEQQPDEGIVDSEELIREQIKQRWRDAIQQHNR